jgi:L-aspartate oxidase
MTQIDLPQRYLVQFNTRRLPHYFTDILVIGAGIAGLRAALAIPDGLEVLVLSKDQLQESNSSYAQGGIAGVLDPEDNFDNHVEDTLRAGAGLCDRNVVEAVIHAAPEQLHDLMRWGTHFDTEAEGKLSLTLEGGHSHRRIVHALGDATGLEVMRAMISRARTTANITLWERTFTIDLLTAENRCLGALIRHKDHGLMCVWAKETILASGGAGQVWRETTNPAVATGDGMALAYRAGAQLMDLEFMQFHPTVLYVAGSSRHLISEAVRGEGAYLRDKNGHRFMPEEDARAELAPRDVVARAIVRQMEKTKHPCAYLDLSHLSAELIHKRFPGIAKACQRFDLDLATDWIPVRPSAHYMVGGVTVDPHGRTTLPGLWAAGEVTSSGLHGANRLASNSLLEGLVYGTWCAQGAVEAAKRSSASLSAVPITSRFASSQEQLNLADLRNSLQSLMVRQAGIDRDAEGLLAARRDVDFWRGYALSHEFATPEGWELQNLLTVATMILWAAMERTESRGVHFRRDYPQPDDVHWKHRQAVLAAVFGEG